MKNWRNSKLNVSPSSLPLLQKPNLKSGKSENCLSNMKLLTKG